MDAFSESAPEQADLRILLVDDHALLRRGLQEFLREFLVEQGLTPFIAETSTAHDALDLVRQAPWELVVLDLNLPDMPGLEIVRIIKSVQPTLPVLVLSIYAEEHYAARAMRAGALGYLTKDTGPDQLRAAVARILKGEPQSAPQPMTYPARQAPARTSVCTLTLPTALSDRELEILQWIAQGQRLTHIADQLNLSIKTVSTYRTRLLTKLGMRTTADLIRYALDQHLV
ncbi:MAG: Response regulator UvrY [Nitrospirae bacterium]|nr:Response regulator UvrY [Nitrospirota bacterium]MCK6493549.1 response regulator transcription factor [Nitrospira sp.]MCK6499001.1 response regulator transcription factor [Nitrospira sp.]MEB2337025.1 response regulator transcription factor [Nitrospirales bacterium]QOJ34600.1 MAG: response regulator transcription factor [Nitrospira sp.]